MLIAVSACDRQASPAPQPAQTREAAGLKSETPGLVTAKQRGTPAPTQAFTTPDGKPVTLAQFKGKPLLVNLWATWCGPCVKEMPGLNKLAEREKRRLNVVVVNQSDDAATIEAWWKTRQLTALTPYRDEPGKLGFAIDSGSLPTSIMYDAEGKEVWRVTGSVAWDDARAAELLHGVTG